MPGHCGSQLLQPGAEGGCSSNSGNVCQDVKEAACYGPTASCQAPSQQCCRMVHQKVCQQVSGEKRTRMTYIWAGSGASTHHGEHHCSWTSGSQ